MQEVRYQDRRVRVHSLLGQTKSLLEEVKLWSLHPSSLLEETDREGEVLLQAGWAKIFARI